MADRFTITTTAGSMGDWLSLTPILRHMRDTGRRPLVIALDSPHTRQFATLYEGLAEVEWAVPGQLVADTPEAGGTGAFSQRVLAAHGVTGVSPIPHVELTDKERIWALDYLTGTVRRHPMALVAFNPTVGGARADLPDSHIANYRRLPVSIRDRLVEQIRSRGMQPIRFGTKAIQSHVYANHEEIPGVLSFPDLSLRELAACYWAIGFYVGVDSGDHHLVLATGGYSECWVPPSTGFYQHHRTLYGPDAWAADGGKVRETYRYFQRAMPTSF